MSDNIIQVLKFDAPGKTLTPSLMTVAAPCACSFSVDDTRAGKDRAVLLKAGKISASVSLKDGRVAFFDAAGKPIAWQHDAVGQSIMAGTFMESMIVKNGIDSTSIEGVSDSAYLMDVPDRRVGLHSPKTGIAVLWWRSVGHSHTAFAMESLVDELAHAAGKDPVEYRRGLLAKHARHLGVLNLAAEKAGWRAWFDHYVFGDDAAAAADHLPMAARGVLGPASDERTERLRNYLLKSLQRR